MENITDETTSYPALFSVLALCEYHSCRPGIILPIFQPWTLPSELPRQELLLCHLDP